MGPLFERYFRLLAGQLPGAEYGVIVSPDDEAQPVADRRQRFEECLCPAG